MEFSNLTLTNQNFFNVISPVTSTGDLILGNGSNSATRLAIGSNGQVLTSNGTTASWQTPSSGGGGTSLTPMYVGSATPFGGSSSEGEIALDADKASVYFAYIISGGPYILNAPASSTLQFRSGNNYTSHYWSAGSRGILSLNCNGQIVTDGVLNISGGNAALQYDQNGVSEFFVKNVSTGNSAGSLVAVEGYNADNSSQPEGWLFLGGHAATNLNAPHAPDVCEIYGRNGVSVRLSTQDAKPIDFWTNATQRAIITSGGEFQFLGDVKLANDTTGSTSLTLGSNSPATNGSAPYTHLKFKSSDGSTVWVAAYK